MQFLSLDDCQIAVEDSGVPGERLPLLLLSGQGNSHHWWDGVVDDFLFHRRVVRFDYVGTGESSSSRSYEYSTRRFARDASTVLATLGIESCLVYGTSMGGKVAQWLAIDRPELVRGLLLGCTSMGGPSVPRADVTLWTSLSGPCGPELLLDLMYTPVWRAGHPGRYHVVGDTNSDAARRGHRRASDRHDSSAEVAVVTAPTLVLQGTDDRLTPPINAELLARSISNSRVTYFPGARHAYFEEHRSRASHEANSFMDALDE